MQDFNLLESSWIKVVKLDNTMDEMNLVEVFTYAHKIKAIGGDSATQDVAVFRLLLAILYAIYTRTPEYARLREKKDDKAVYGLWRDIWDEGEFDHSKITDYLMQHYDRFWLVHPTHPFYQVAKLKLTDSKGNIKPYLTMRHFIGNILVSDNKERLFGKRLDSDSITYAEAARWLLRCHYYDPIVERTHQAEKLGKPKKFKYGWLGGSGYVCVEGDNLFETLMLNLVLLPQNTSKAFWEDAAPYWENPPITQEDEGREIVPLPDNPAAFMTIPMRLITLFCTSGRVSGFYKICGLIFSAAYANQIEQMSMWYKKTVNKVTTILPKLHDVSASFWQGFPALVGRADENGKAPIPGVVNWITALEDYGAFKSKLISVYAVAVTYKSGGCIDHEWSDSFTLKSTVLADYDNADKWVKHIVKTLNSTKNMVRIVGDLALALAKASGFNTDKLKPKEKKEREENKRRPAKAEAYSLLDSEFREWLMSIDPAANPPETCKGWIEKAHKILFRLGMEMVENAGGKALTGRIEKNAKADLKFQKSIFAVRKLAVEG